MADTEKKPPLLTPEARASFVFIWSPNQRSTTKDGKPKYQISLLFPPGADLSKLEAAAAACAKERWGEKLGSMKIKRPFLDAGEYPYEGYEKGWKLLRLSSVQKPGVVGRDAKKLDDETKLYSGCWVRCEVSPYTYPKDGVKDQAPGVSFGLLNLQVTRDGPPLSGRGNAEDSFEALPESEGGEAPSSADDMWK